MVLGVGFLPGKPSAFCDKSINSPLILIIALGLFVTKGIESHMKKRKDGSVAEIINQWNHVRYSLSIVSRW